MRQMEQEGGYPILRVSGHPELIGPASRWFASKWHVPEQAYAESMRDCAARDKAVPEWYVMKDGDAIIAGLGVIDNDFHNRSDLTPNVCAVYVEEPYRGQGLAGALLRTVCGDFADRGISTLYLLTDHTAFYERYGWRYLCPVQGDGEERMSRMYIHESR